MAKFVVTVALLLSSASGLLGDEAKRTTRTALDVLAHQIDRIHAATERDTPTRCDWQPAQLPGVQP